MQAILQICHAEKIPFVARGSGTGLSGGALPVENGIVISLTRMNRILEVDIPNARVVVEPGVINLDVTGRVLPQEYFYAPDPSSQSVCSIGGNVAENSGGAHCLKYGFTTTHVLGLEVVLPDGSLVHLGGKSLDAPGYDLAGVFVGSEGTLGIATKVILRIVKRPECVQTLLAAFPSTNEAGAAVSGIIAAGMLPAAIEMMDNLAIQAAEAAVHANYPNCGALLLVELDGPFAEVESLMKHVDAICRENGASEIRVAQSETERALVWKGRKAAFAAVGRISPNYIVQDGVIPRTALPQVMSEIDRLSKETGVRVANVFHAGDGNLASARALRSPHRRTGRSRRSALVQDSRDLHRCRRFDHRRARRRRREKARDVENVQRARSRNDAARALRVRSAAACESGQGFSAPAPLRRKTRQIRAACARNRRNRGAFLTMDASAPADTARSIATFEDGSARDRRHGECSRSNRSKIASLACSRNSSSRLAMNNNSRKF